MTKSDGFYPVAVATPGADKVDAVSRQEGAAYGSELRKKPITIGEDSGKWQEKRIDVGTQIGEGAPANAISEGNLWNQILNFFAAKGKESVNRGKT